MNGVSYRRVLLATTLLLKQKKNLFARISNMQKSRIEEPKLGKASEFRHEINRGRYIRNVLSTIILPALMLFSITSCCE